jgi:Fe-S cluster assembly ATP-binding protein
MFHIKNLHIDVSAKPILHGVSLTIRPGEIHAIMGPNGSGKSTLANAIMGHPKYTVTEGEIRMDKENLITLKADKRARAGLFLAFQYPKEIPGVTVASFLQTAVASVRKARGLSPRSPVEFRKALREKLNEFSLDSKFMNRSMNEGFSGGEKKKMEILQMALLEPRVAILDETDSGLDVDALKIVAEGIKKLATPERGVLLITHYQRILHYVTPHFVHVMMEGRIVKEGGPELAQRLEKDGYEWIKNDKGQSSNDQSNPKLKVQMVH